MKNKFPSLNGMNGKAYPYGRKGVLRNYHYWPDPKLVPGIFAIRIITCSFHTCTLYYFFTGIQKPKKQLTSLDMVKYIIASALKFLIFKITVL